MSEYCDACAMRDKLAKHGTWFWAGVGDDRVRVIVDEEQPEGEFTMLPEKPPVRMKRVGYMLTFPDGGKILLQTLRGIAGRALTGQAVISSIYARKDDL